MLTQGSDLVGRGTFPKRELQDREPRSGLSQDLMQTARRERWIEADAERSDLLLLHSHGASSRLIKLTQGRTRAVEKTQAC